MKSHDETINSVFDRINAYQVAQKRRRKMITRTATSFGCFCLVALIGFGVWRTGVFHTPIGETSDKTESSEGIQPNPEATIPSGKWKKEWNGKRIGYALNEALEQSKDNELLSIRASCSLDDQFVYEGKTLAEYRAEKEAEWKLDEKLAYLLKHGEVLQYGEAVYQTGTPNGERWAKELYDDTVAYFGKEFLEKYIVNGVFLREKAESDYAVCKEHKTQEAYETACNAYVRQRLEEAGKQLHDQNISYEMRAGCGYGSYGYLVFHVSVKEFASLSLDRLSEWYFDLYSDEWVIEPAIG